MPRLLSDVAESFGKAAPRASFSELGTTGLRRIGGGGAGIGKQTGGGYVYEEFLPRLQDRQGIEIYREMSDNDPTVGAFLYAIDKLARQVKWRVQPASQSEQDQTVARFVESCLGDMNTPWEDAVSECLSMLIYGWSFHEIVYKRREGFDGRTFSQYDDGLIGWKGFPIRSQDSLERWEFGPKGDIRGMHQEAPPEYKAIFVPMNRAVLFRTTSFKNNPQGRSILRNAYRSWYFKKRIEEIEAIGIERDLAGFPIMHVDPSLLDKNANVQEKAMLQAYADAVRRVRRDEQESLILPSMFDESGHPLYRLELLGSPGSRQFSTGDVIDRLDRAIARSVMADFMFLGQGAHGSYALSSDKTNLFALGLRSYLEIIKNAMNNHVIPKLIQVNGIPVQDLPGLEYSDIETPPLTEIGTFIQQLAGAGAVLFPDDQLQDHLMELAKFPERRPEAVGAASKVYDAQRKAAEEAAKPKQVNGAQGANQKQPQLNAGNSKKADPASKQVSKAVEEVLKGHGKRRRIATG